jgi:hypothetical protein
MSIIPFGTGGRKPARDPDASGAPAPASPSATVTNDARCSLCIRQTPQCHTDSAGRFWCGGGHGYVPGYTLVEERDGLPAYIITPPTPFPAPPPAPPLTPLPTCTDITEQFAPDQRDYLRACIRFVEAAERAAQFRAAGALGEAERAELDRLEALGDKQSARQRAADAHLFAERAAHDLHPGAGPVAEALAELCAEVGRHSVVLADLIAGRTGRGAA